MERQLYESVELYSEDGPQKAGFWLHLGIFCVFIVQVSWKTEILGWMCWSCKDSFWTISTLVGNSGLERTNFQQLAN